MKRVWGFGAIAVLACAAFVGAATKERGAPPPRQVLATPVNGTATPDATGAATLELPAMPGHGLPVPLELTRSMVQAALASGTLMVRQPGGGRYPVRMVRGEADSRGRWTAVGKVATRSGLQSMVLTFHGRNVFGVLPLPDGSQLAVTTTRGEVGVTVSGGMVPPGWSALGNPDFAVPPAPPRRNSASAVSFASPHARAEGGAADDTVQVDLLGLYSDELVAIRGSVDAAETEVINQVEIANQVHVDSGTRVRFSLSGLEQITVPAGILNHPLLSALTNNSLEGIDVRELREAAAADLVFVLRPYQKGDPTCGTGWLVTSELGRTNANPDLGYSISNVGTQCGSYVVPHELGHNLGSMHDRETSTNANGVQYGAFPYSFGYRQPGPPGFATVMAYETAHEPWVGYFSSPTLMACGASCGVADEADNVRSLEQVAPAVAAFRGPAGQVAPADLQVLEPISGDSTSVYVPVRLYGGAPAGGLTLVVEPAGGTASAGSDFDVPESLTLELVPGQEETGFRMDVMGDDAVEGDETLLLHVSSPDDAGIDAMSVLTIVDDDPRVLITGRVLIPPGEPAPTEPFYLAFDGFEQQVTKAKPPEFTYGVAVVKGAEISVTCMTCPDPYADPPAIGLGYVKADMTYDFQATKGVLVTGKVLVPDGDPGLSGLVTVRFTESIPGQKPRDRYVWMTSPDYSYRMYLWPGALLNVNIDAPPAPYQPYWFRLPRLQEDLEQDLVLSTLPSLVVWGNDRNYEQQNAGPVMGLSAPAPAGGVTVTYSLHSGTAVGGEDYQPAEHVTATIPEGNKGTNFGLHFIDDSRYEPTEYFDMVVDQVEGATPTVPAMRVVIEDNDAHTGGPAQKQPAP